MLKIVSCENSYMYRKELSSMHRLRDLVFRERLGWSLKSVNGMEFDQYDNDNAIYIIHQDENGEVNACARLLPTTVPHMLNEVFPYMVNGGETPCNDDTWEITRFGANTDTAPCNIVGLLIAGMLEFGSSIGLNHYVSVTDIPIEKLLKRAEWPPTRLGEPMIVGDDSNIPAAAEIYEVSKKALNKVKLKLGINSNIITNLEEIERPLEKVA